MKLLRHDASEHEHQAALFAWASLLAKTRPELGLLYAIPNAGKRTLLAGVEMKREGLKKGMPDTCLPVARGAHGALYVELKTRSGDISPAQLDRLGALHAAGNACYVARGWEAASEIILRYLSGSLTEGRGGW